MLKITQKKGLVGATQTQKATVLSLGLHKIHQSVTHPDNAAVRGQIRKVAHLVDVEEVK
ncbi:50S ribosomal protein L30 [Trueperella pecoris]|uniref:Large ribosomal subunit protein uL30 n=1 Tax=Trueperella pecoris TaxID=2733571 RepID=A0A7M1QZ75_9ACTO|nr:50S ribosomal protein L30 [Trueperella pecoris]QOQ38381.1 50S ribosomal protein L30 [Trueperella pecoris]QOR45130.1 50S ribosomal protein L30 [Trueperella pecoris]QOR47176.1 50S ribosomal protein L30 [Trueperella pecoris]QTG75036.1 50S ribosomal protein L30 [Trueperella pecoris]